MRCLLLTLLLLAPCARAQSLTAEAIMARVAANQDQSQAERAHFVYLQHARVSSRKGQTVRCEEITDTRVTPTANGSHQDLLKLDGRLLVKRQYVTYTQLPPYNTTYKQAPDDPAVDADKGHVSVTINSEEESYMDRGLVEGLRSGFVDDHSKDGIGAGLFPLTSKAQAVYTFHLVGLERMNGRDTFHIAFDPNDKNEFGWRGDAYIDTAAFQPVLVRTTMARKIPFAVRTLLGTSLPGLGFTVIYAPTADGLWFPVSFGTEFKLHFRFFLNREITLSAENRNFEKTHVTSTITSTTKSP